MNTPSPSPSPFSSMVLHRRRHTADPAIIVAVLSASQRQSKGRPGAAASAKARDCAAACALSRE